MGDIHYMISEAAKVIRVESHVLRYWEEELGLTIGRTEMGHRYYTEEDMQLFQCIRKLKDEGVLLKELKVLIPEIQKAKKFKKNSGVLEKKVTKLHVHKEKECEPDAVEGNAPSMELVVEQELKKNNIILEEAICSMVTESLKREMSYLLDAKEHLEEERYRRLDTLIRQQQIQRKEYGKKRVPVLMKQVLGMS